MRAVDWAMACFVSHTTVNCSDAYALSEWWKSLLTYVDVEGDPNEPGHEECMILDPESGHHILFIEVPDPHVGRNSMHFDVRPRAGSRDEEVARVRELGATEVADRRNPDGTGWVVFADPEGNEFCVLRSLAEVAAGPRP